MQLGDEGAHLRAVVPVHRVGHGLDEGVRDLAVLVPKNEEGLSRLRGLVGIEHGGIPRFGESGFSAL